jgi:hypothetical protein
LARRTDAKGTFSGVPLLVIWLIKKADKTSKDYLSFDSGGLDGKPFNRLPEDVFLVALDYNIDLENH